ncbi:hypothetical protein NH340_JMT07916 [Sarcoptes scabiei]|nr:hypothetical protein NH340_JMT07916 [Sarcoptes scabiei]
MIILAIKKKKKKQRNKYKSLLLSQTSTMSSRRNGNFSPYPHPSERRNFQQNSNRERFVEQFFFSIDELKWDLILLRENISNLLTMEYLDYFVRIEISLDRLKFSSAFAEDLICRRNREGDQNVTMDLNEFQQNIYASHLERIRISQLIRAINPSEINLSVVFNTYTMVGYYLVGLGYQSLRVVELEGLNQN